MITELWGVYSDKTTMALDEQYPVVPIIREMMKQSFSAPVEEQKRHIFNVLRKILV
jgi:hypothetical protein